MEIKSYIAFGFQWVAVMALLSLVLVVHPELPADEMIGQWVWFDKAAIIASVCSLLSILLGKRAVKLTTTVTWALIVLGGIEAIWGLRQLYGFTASGHSRYALTGSFFNPGPYSGYLAMILSLCFYQYLSLHNSRLLKTWVWWMKNIVAGSVMLLILCVLPAGMSRSAWLAAGISCLWVYACHVGWGIWLREVWIHHRKRLFTAIAVGVGIMVLAGYLLFSLKPDSARGRLFMWKITCRAIMEKPLAGHGTDNFAVAYGKAQEDYFATGNYEPWEERVAGSPEYAFNEYLQAAVEWGVPLTLCGLAAIVICLYIGIKKSRYGICGAILSLLIFSFSSYPLQLPVFIITFIALLLACVCGNSRWEWIGLAILTVAVGGFRLKNDLRIEQACREWMNVRVLYNAGAYESGEREYVSLYPLLKERAAFLFEYGHGLHKLRRAEASNRIMREALRRSCDPMILNIMGKNYQQKGDYLAAEECFIRSTRRLPGRIYPYYLLAKLYAEPAFRQPDKFEKMKRIVLTKEPKVQSTAIKEMREELNKILIY